MKTSTLTTVLTSVAAAAAGIYAFKAYQKKNEFEVAEGVDMHNSKKIDERESVDADEEPEEEGLTQLDSAYRDEWQANAFPQTHREMKKLEEEK